MPHVIKINISREAARAASFPLHGETLYEIQDADADALEPQLRDLLPDFYDSRGVGDRLQVTRLDGEADDPIWAGVRSALYECALDAPDERAGGERQIKEWCRNHPTLANFRRAVEEGYPVAGAYLTYAAGQLEQADLALNPKPDRFVLPRSAFVADYAIETRTAPSHYAFAVHDRVTEACSSLRERLADGTRFNISRISRISQTVRGGSERPYTGVVVEVSHAGVPEPLCVVFTAEQP